MSINWQPIAEFNKADQETEYLFYSQFQAYDYVSVGTYYPCLRNNGVTEELIDCGFDVEGTYPRFEWVTHFAEIDKPAA